MRLHSQSASFPAAATRIGKVVYTLPTGTVWLLLLCDIHVELFGVMELVGAWNKAGWLG